LRAAGRRRSGCGLRRADMYLEYIEDWQVQTI
jgi:hypothetical protein